MTQGLRYILLVLALSLITDLAFSQTLSTTGLQNLEFRNEIFPGIKESVARTDGSAAKYEISGEASREVQITFNLPANLTDGLGNNLSISFNSNDAGYSTSGTGKSSAISFDPRTGVIASLSTDGKLYVWLGGTVSPVSSQPGNTYTGDLILDVTYTN